METQIFIFSSEGVCLKQADAPIASSQFPCSLIPNGHVGNDYFFTIIFTTDNNGDGCNSCTLMKFRKGIYNSNNTLSF